MLKILAVGSGGREHVLVWRLAQDAAPYNLYAAPGNPGIARLGTCHSVSPTDIPGLLQLAADLEVDLTVVGPEAPLAAGIVDAFRARGLRIFGPTRLAAEIESSKAFAKALMRRHRIPTPDFEIFTRVDDALAFVGRADRPLVVKADGLAAGKGVVVAADRAEAERAVLDRMVHGRHGAAGARVVIEDRLNGREASVLAFVSGSHVFPLLPAQDYKRALDGDRGPNTGGMGAIAPAPLPGGLMDQVVDEILEPVAAAMVREGRPYTGVLYAGIMVTAEGPKVLEFNCRFGDPEAQVILPLLQGSLADILLDVLDGRTPPLRWSAGTAVCVVLASGGYPGPYRTGFSVTGLEQVPPHAQVFHAGTAISDHGVVTAGGRVLNVVGLGPTPEGAVSRAYAGAAQISFERMQFRSDIGRDVPTASTVFAASVSGGAH